MKEQIAIISAKMAKNASKIIGFGGGNIPGVIARKVDIKILKKLSQEIENIILVTGTNGKTTTSNFLANMIRAEGKSIIHNAEGNNLITGITSCFALNADIKGHLHKQFAIIEVDEATIVRVAKEINPKAIVVTNFFRDQLDRFGEIDILIQKIQKAIEPLDTKLILNADDPFTVRLGDLHKDTIYFGFKENAYTFEQYAMSESKFCPHCGNQLNYTYVHYGQLGFYSCNCGFKRPNALYEVNKIEENKTFKIEKKSYQLKVEGAYNVYNALAAIACAKEFGISENSIKKGLETFESKNGRMQSFHINQTERLLNLVKNPAGVNSSLSEVLKEQEEKQIVFFLNDLNHDSMDISWIWDSDFERLEKATITQFICSGTRAYDAALRIKYTGFPEEKIVIIENKQDAINEALKRPIKTYFLPTYTALNPVKKYLEKQK